MQAAEAGQVSPHYCWALLSHKTVSSTQAVEKDPHHCSAGVALEHIRAYRQRSSDGGLGVINRCERAVSVAKIAVEQEIGIRVVSHDLATIVDAEGS